MATKRKMKDRASARSSGHGTQYNESTENWIYNVSIYRYMSSY